MLFRSSLVSSSCCGGVFTRLFYIFEAVEGIIELGSEIVECFDEFLADKAVALVIRILNFFDKVLFKQS